MAFDPDAYLASTEPKETKQPTETKEAFDPDAYLAGTVRREEEPSAIGAAARGALRGALPSAAGIVAGGAGAVLGAPAGPAGVIAGGLGAGFAGATAMSAAQEKFLEEHPEIAKSLGLDKETLSKDIAAHPYASMAGEIAPNLLAFRPSASLLRSGKGLTEQELKLLRGEKIAAATNAVFGAGVGAGMEAGQQLMGEEEMDPARLGIAALGGALGQKETRIGRTLTRVGELPASAASRAAVSALRRPGEVTPPEVSTIAPEAPVGPEEVPKSASQSYEDMIKEIPEAGKPSEFPITPKERIFEEPAIEPVVAEKQQVATVEPTVSPKEMPPTTPKVVPVDEPITKLTKKEEPAPTPVKVEPVKVNRYQEPDVQESLKRYAGEAGWSQRGGLLLRENAEDNTSPVIGRTQWTPNASWWTNRPVILKGDGEGRATQRAVNKAIAGEKLTPNEKKMVDFLVNMHDTDMTEGDRIRAEMEARDLENQKFWEEFYKKETPEQVEARTAEEQARIKAQEDAEIEAEMARKAEESRAEIARRSQERAQDFALGQTPEESLTGQRRIFDEDIPFEKPITIPNEKFSGDAEALGQTLRASMDQMGLKNIGLQLSDSLKARVNGKMENVNGAYFDNLIALSLNGDNIHRTMNHEALHAMRDHGFFKPKDWATLSRKAESEWMQKYGIAKDYSHLSKDLQLEEAIAKAFADYRTQPAKIKSIMAKVIDALKRIGNVLRGRGYRNAEDIFKAAGEGRLTPSKEPLRRAMFEIEKKPKTAENILGQKVGATWEHPPVTLFSEFTRLFQDKHVDLKRTVEAIKKKFGEFSERWDPYQKAGLYHSKLANRSRVFVETEVDALVKDMYKLKVTNDELHDYLHNRHAEEYNKQMNKINPDVVLEDGTVVPYGLKDRASGIHTEDARKYLAGLETNKKAALEKVAKHVDDIIKGTQKLLVESGYEKQSTIDAWNKTYEYYVPLFRELESNKMSTLSPKGFATRGAFSKRAMGSEREVADIVNSVIGQREKAYELAEKMEVTHALYGLAIKSPNPDIWLPVNPDAIKNPELLSRELDAMGLDGKDILGLMQEQKTRKLKTDPATGIEKVVSEINPLERYRDNVLPIRINGEDRFIFFNKDNPTAKNMAEAFRNMDTATAGLVGKQIGKATQWMAKVNTQWNPVFGAINFMRDFGSAMANLSTTEIRGQQKAVASGIKPALQAIWSTMRAERSGEALPNTAEAKLYQEFRAHGGQTLYREQIVRRADQEKLINEKIKQLDSSAAKKRAHGFFNVLSDINDTIENAIRLSAYKVAREKGLSAEKAATLAKELTVNFDRKGAYSQNINNYFAFFNASAQGISRLTQTLKGPAGKKIILGGLGLGALQAGMMEMAGFGENDPPEFIKSRNMILPLPDGTYFAIPYPLGLHFLPNIGRLVVETGLHGHFQKHAGNMAAVIADSFNPLGGGDLSLQTISPTVLDPVVALATNKDAFGRPISKEDRATAPTPGYSRSREQATSINKAIAEALNYITGGTADTKGFVSPTADQLDFLGGQLTGGVGREAMKVLKTTEAIATGETEKLPSYQVPLAGRFYGDITSPAAISQNFYDNVTRMAEHENTIKGMRQRKENVSEYLRDNPEARLWQRANDIENKISKLNKMKKDLADKDVPKERLDRIDDQKQRLMSQFNEQVKRLTEQVFSLYFQKFTQNR